jgi:hypothetical protein
MSFASPIWLTLLLPWAALAAWLLSGRREEARVPFVHLWPRSAAPARIRRALRIPPVSIACLLGAVLLAVLGSAGPHVARPSNARQHNVTLIVDLYVTSPARDAGGADLQPSRVVLVRGDATEEVEPSNWRQRVGKRTAVPTLPALRAAVADALARDARPIVVLTNQRLGIASDRVVNIGTDDPPNNVGIVRLAARERPVGQVMVTVRNQSPGTRAELTVSSNGAALRQTIELPPTAGERDYFVDMPRLGQTIATALDVQDDIDADNCAWLVRVNSWPDVEARGNLPPELARVIETYGRLRRADSASKRIIVTATMSDEPAAILSDGGAARSIAGPLQVVDHPIGSNVEWDDALGPARVGELVGGGWTPLVHAGERVLVAVRERPARQVWVGFDSDTWPRQSSFVIFWTNVFDWLGGGGGGGGGGGEVFVGEPVRQPGTEWRRLDDLSGAITSPALPPAPGIWGRTNGDLRALNAIDIRLDPPLPNDGRAKLAALKTSGVARRATLAGPALVAALVLTLIASLTWASVKRAPALA